MLCGAEAGSWSDRHPWSRRGDGVASLRSLSPVCERPECRSGARLLRTSCRRPSARRPDRLAFSMGCCPHRRKGHMSCGTRDGRTLSRRRRLDRHACSSSRTGVWRRWARRSRVVRSRRAPDRHSGRSHLGDSERRDATSSPRGLHGCRSDRLPASGGLRVAYVFGRETCIDLVAVLGLGWPNTSHIVSMRAGVECPPGDRCLTFEVASYCGLIPAASMIRAALSLSRSTNRVKSGCVMLIGSPSCFTSEARTPGSDRARSMSSASV